MPKQQYTNALRAALPTGAAAFVAVLAAAFSVSAAADGDTVGCAVFDGRSAETYRGPFSGKGAKSENIFDTIRSKVDIKNADDCAALCSGSSLAHACFAFSYRADQNKCTFSKKNGNKRQSGFLHATKLVY